VSSALLETNKTHPVPKATTPSSNCDNLLRILLNVWVWG
jgi:hypothetical protein